MKKLLTIAFCAAAASVMAVDVGMGQVGLYNFTCPADVKENLIAVCFDDLASGEASVPVSNLVQTVNLAVGDELYIFGYTEDAEGYQGFELKETEPGGVKYWDAIATSYTLGTSGLRTIKTGSADSVNMTAGQGFWLVRTDGSTNQAVTVTVYGKPHTAAQQALVQNKRNLCGNPTNAPAFPTITNATEDDTILIPDSTGMGYTMGIYKSNQWYWNTGASTDSVKIPALAGFWYTPKGAETTLAW